MAQSRVASENAPKLTNFEVICQLTERSTYEIAWSLPDKVSENINLFSFICYGIEDCIFKANAPDFKLFDQLLILNFKRN